MNDSEQCSNRLQFNLISLLVNFAYEFGPIITRFYFYIYTSSSVNLFTSMLSQSCLNIHTGETSRTYISMFMLLSVSCPSLRTVQTDSIIYKYCYL